MPSYPFSSNHAFPKVLPGRFRGRRYFLRHFGLPDRWAFAPRHSSRTPEHLGDSMQNERGAYSLLSHWCLFPYGVLAGVVYSAPEFASLGKHIAAAAFFSNNILLWSESGYFDTAALDKPLLHLWSLGIEEQFYLLIPAMLWARHQRIDWIGSLGGALRSAVAAGNDSAEQFRHMQHHSTSCTLASGNWPPESSWLRSNCERSRTVKMGCSRASAIFVRDHIYCCLDIWSGPRAIVARFDSDGQRTRFGNCRCRQPRYFSRTALDVGTRGSPASQRRVPSWVPC